jgi:hypothetical protein
VEEMAGLSELPGLGRVGLGLVCGKTCSVE